MIPDGYIPVAIGEEEGGDCGGGSETERLPLPKPRGEIQHGSSANFPHERGRLPGYL